MNPNCTLVTLRLILLVNSMTPKYEIILNPINVTIHLINNYSIYIWWWWLTSNETNFGLSSVKKENTWFTIKLCPCAKKACQEPFQNHYSFGKFGGYKGLSCSKYYETHIKCGHMQGTLRESYFHPQCS